MMGQGVPSGEVHAADLVVVFWLIIGVVVMVFLGLLAYRWWNAEPTQKDDSKMKFPSWFRPSNTPETRRLPQVIVKAGEVTSVRTVNPNVRCGDSDTGEIEHYRKESEAEKNRPTFEGGFTETLDPDTGEIIGEYVEVMG